jgi:predicted acyltransferase
MAKTTARLVSLDIFRGMTVAFMIIVNTGFSSWGGFFRVFGSNALFSFFLAGIWTKTMLYLVRIPAGEETMTLYNWIYRKICVPLAGEMNGSLMFSLLQVLIIWLFAYFLYRKNIFVRL